MSPGFLQEGYRCVAVPVYAYTVCMRPTAAVKHNAAHLLYLLPIVPITVPTYLTHTGQMEGVQQMVSLQKDAADKMRSFQALRTDMDRLKTSLQVQYEYDMYTAAIVYVLQ